jgi:amidophosphoribosyltransferase
MAANYSLKEICRYLNADSLHYLSEAGMVKATGLPKESFCMACYNGNYPVPFDAGVDKHIIERRIGRLPNLAESLAKEKAQIKLL